MFLYETRFDMDRLVTCLDDMEGFLDSKITHTPTLYIHSETLRCMNIYECLNVIDDDVYDVTYCENEKIYECLNTFRMMLDMMQSILVNDNLMNGCRN